MKNVLYSEGGGGGLRCYVNFREACWLCIAGIIRRFNFHAATHAAKLDLACVRMYIHVHAGLACAYPYSRTSSDFSRVKFSWMLLDHEKRENLSHAKKFYTVPTCTLYMYSHAFCVASNYHSHLSRVASFSDANKMPRESLAKIFGPTIVGHGSSRPDPSVQWKDAEK